MWEGREVKRPSARAAAAPSHCRLPKNIFLSLLVLFVVKQFARVLSSLRAFRDRNHVNAVGI
jgi:hypothetical protein